MYTPEQIRQCISWLAGNFRVTADGKYRECADILAATLKAAQGGDAFNWGEFWNRISQNFDSADVDKVRACYKAALSAQQGQGEEAVAVPKLMRKEDGPDYVKPEMRAAWRDGWNSARTWVLTAPPAQPAERVPEDTGRIDWMEANARSVSFGKAPTQGYWVHVQGIGYSGGSNRSLREAIDAARKAQAASPAPSPARGDGECGFCGRPGKHKIGESCLTKSATFQLNAGEP